jgi:hypothetical protein
VGESIGVSAGVEAASTDGRISRRINSMIEKRIEFPTVFRFFATSFFGDLHRLKTFENFVHLWLATHE